MANESKRTLKYSLWSIFFHVQHDSLANIDCSTLLKQQNEQKVIFAGMVLMKMFHSVLMFWLISTKLYE